MFPKRRLLPRVGLLLLAASFLPGCAQPAEIPVPTLAQTEESAWMEVELTDVATGEKFRISDFRGKPILLESFAVWCPTCLAQQKEMAKMRANGGEDIVHISLDTDPNEDADKVREHMERNGLDWYFAVSPVELTEALISEFGLKFVNAPRAPVVLICEDGSSRFLRSGVKPVDELEAEVAQGCP